MPLYIQCLLHRLTRILLCVPFIFLTTKTVNFVVGMWWLPFTRFLLYCCITGWTCHKKSWVLHFSDSAIKVATMKITDDFCYKWKLSTGYLQIDTFTVRKDEWDTKEGTGKSMENALYVQQCGKRHLSGWSNIKQWKNQVHLVNLWHQSGRQAFSS